MQTKKATSTCSDHIYYSQLLLATIMQNDVERQMQEIVARDELPKTDNLRKLEELIKKQQQTASSKELSVSTASEEAIKVVTDYAKSVNVDVADIIGTE